MTRININMTRSNVNGKRSIRATGLGGVLLVVLLLGGSLLLSGWLVMLILGALHSGIPQVPAFGYGFSIVIALALDILGSFFKDSSK